MLLRESVPNCVVQSREDMYWYWCSWWTIGCLYHTKRDPSQKAECSSQSLMMKKTYNHVLVWGVIFIAFALSIFCFTLENILLWMELQVLQRSWTPGFFFWLLQFSETGAEVRMWDNMLVFTKFPQCLLCFFLSDFLNSFWSPSKFSVETRSTLF